MRAEVRYSGRVQGVGFRATAAAVAARFDVTGWVRNEQDGTVRLQVQGHDEEVMQFLVKLREAMGRNIVNSEFSQTPQVDGEQSFRILR